MLPKLLHEELEIGAARRWRSLSVTPPASPRSHGTLSCLPQHPKSQHLQIDYKLDHRMEPMSKMSNFTSYYLAITAVIALTAFTMWVNSYISGVANNHPSIRQWVVNKAVKYKKAKRLNKDPGDRWLKDFTNNLQGVWIGRVCVHKRAHTQTQTHI